MTTYVVSTPDCVCDLESVKTLVVDHNTRILLGHAFPAVVETLDPKTLIGNPMHHLSEDICEMLWETGVLVRTQHQNAKGKQVALADGTLLWNYAWGQASFAELSVQQLEAVAWDLRAHRHFAHVSIIEEPDPNGPAHPELQEECGACGALDCEEVHVTQEELEGMPWEYVVPPDHPGSAYYTGEELTGASE